MNVISLRENPEYAAAGISYFTSKWGNERLYGDCIKNCLNADMPLPQWYLLEDKGRIIGCAGLITNDFISRGDLYPWFCALYIEEERRGHRYSKLLIHRASEDAKKMGFKSMHLCTDHIGFYEKYGFKYIGDGYHPWGESSRVYSINL